MRGSKAQLGFGAIFCCFGIGLTVMPLSKADISAAALARPCLTCHQMKAVPGASVPDLTTLPRKDLEAALADFRKHPNDFVIMGRIAAAYSDTELSSIVEYFLSHGGVSSK